MSSICPVERRSTGSAENQNNGGFRPAGQMRKSVPTWFVVLGGCCGALLRGAGEDTAPTSVIQPTTAAESAAVARPKA